MKRNCINCHYLHFKGITLGGNIDDPLPMSSRKELKNGAALPIPGGPQRYVCSDGMWDQETSTDTKALLKDILEKNWGENECHYIEIKSDGATTEAIARLHDENKQGRDIKINRWIAIAAITVSIGIPVIQYIF